MPQKISSKKEIPVNVTQWKKAAKKWRALGAINTLGSQEKVKSASKFEFKHFLGLRVIYVPVQKKSVLPAAITSQFPLPPDAGLESLNGWNAYLDQIESFRNRRHTISTISSTSVPTTLGALTNVWQFHRHVLLGNGETADISKVSEVSPVAIRTRARMMHRLARFPDPLLTPTPGPRFHKLSLSEPMRKMPVEDEVALENEAEGNSVIQEEEFADEQESGWEVAEDDVDDTSYISLPGSEGRPIKDEQTVNVFLLALLSAITATTIPFHTRWLAERNSMLFQKNVQFVARTDGHLRNEKGQSFSLIEVKPRSRAGDVAIRIQETAQMAAFISESGMKSHDPEKHCSIFLLSQDKDEIYVTFPYFTEAYGRDDKNAVDLKETDFLRMREYGPFRLRSKDDMKHIAHFLLAYTLQVSKR